jgi:hypothetical protein
VTNTANLNWQRDIRESQISRELPESGDHAIDFKMQYEELKSSTGFMQDIGTIFITNNWNDKSRISNELKACSVEKKLLGAEKKVFCCTKRVEYFCKLTLEKTRFGKEEKYVNIKFEFERGILDRYLYLETILYCSYTRSNDNGKIFTSTNILQYSSHSMVSSLKPGSSDLKIIAYDCKLPISDVNQRVFTFQSETMAVKCGIKFFLSKQIQKFQSEIHDQEVIFYLPTKKPKSNTMNVFTDYMWTKIQKLNDKVTRAIMLPHTQIDMSSIVS